ncbi:NmrA family NAD(P)-binding protein [Pseudoflavitalea rhizosphaerae]|uniref:NmrA family NAD(P)-binding protein n=1 Tax=Pseudoflavitalea rhizosphaerae TaxID=1884793 RepID=UPI000F8CE23B|nr:NmrA family NAD(P)-binding protein [Pseudoflavitalea rhizosphaerae]
MNTNKTVTTAIAAPIFVIGGNGRTGKRIVQRLNELRIPVRVGSRSGDPSFDWTNRSTWAPALEGMKAVYISYQPDLAVEGATDDIRYLAELAAKAGIQKLVLLSGRGEPEAMACEEIIQQSGIDHTILRCSWFFQNFSESVFQEPLQAGLLALPTGDMKEPFVDADDIAEVAVAAFTDAKHANRLYELTGPRLMTFKEITAEIAKATGRDIRFQDVSIEEYCKTLEGFGLPPDYVQFISYLFTELFDGRNASLTKGVQQALNREPSDFSSFVQKNIPTGIWS